MVETAEWLEMLCLYPLCCRTAYGSQCFCPSVTFLPFNSISLCRNSTFRAVGRVCVSGGGSPVYRR